MLPDITYQLYQHFLDYENEEPYLRLQVLTDVTRCSQSRSMVHLRLFSVGDLVVSFQVHFSALTRGILQRTNTRLGGSKPYFHSATAVLRPFYCALRFPLLLGERNSKGEWIANIMENEVIHNKLREDREFGDWDATIWEFKDYP
jgi:hypothetical protein